MRWYWFDRVALSAVLLAVLVTSCVSCAHGFKRETFRQRDIDGAARAVALYVSCTDVDGTITQKGTGTGIIVSRDRVITAWHVVNCGQASASILIENVAGVMAPGRVELVALPNDIARVKYRGKLLENAAPPTVGIVTEAQEGQLVCAYTARPVRDKSCGVLYRVLDDENGIRYVAPTLHGNSGSGVYDFRGRLIAITLAMYTDGDGFAGQMAPVAWMIPEAI